MTDQKEHTDRFLAWQQAFREKFGINRPQLLQKLDDSKSFYLFCRIIYAIEDSLSFLFGNLKLIFSLMHSYKHESDSGAADDLHTFMVTVDGIIVTAVIGALLIIIQVAGAVLLDSKDLNENKYKYFFAKILAPYLRDVLQGVKWAYKGMRSVLNTIFYFMLAHKGIILKILFPLSIGIAVLSLLNRVFLRWMRNLRKWLQSNNRKRSIQAYEMGCDLKFRKKLPKDGDGEAWEKLKNSLLYDLSAEEDAKKLYYVGDDCKRHQISVSDKTLSAIKEKIKEFQTENVLRRVKKEIIDDMNRRFKNQDVRYEKFAFIDLAGCDPDGLCLTKEYHNSLVYLTDKEFDGETHRERDKHRRLYRVDGRGRLISDYWSAYYSRLIQNEIDNKAALNLLTSQLDELVALIHLDDQAQRMLEELGVDKNHRFGPTSEELDAFKLANKYAKEKRRTWFGYGQEVEVDAPKIVEQPKWLMYFTYMAVFLCALIDSSYFYIGVLFISLLNPAQFISMLAMAAVMMVICLVGRLYEEYNYQKVFTVSQIEVRLNTQKTLCRDLFKQYQKLQEEIKELSEQPSEHDSGEDFVSISQLFDSEAQIEFAKKERLIQDKKVKQAEILEKLKVALQEYDEEQRTLDSTLHMSTTEAFFRGLRNGLSSQGVVSSLMFLGAVIMLLSGVPCPPLFLISMMAISFAYMAYSITTFMLSHREYERNYKKLEPQKFEELTGDNDADFDKLTEIKTNLDENVICRPPYDDTEEQEELRRLFLSGFCKAQKNFGEFTLGAARDSESWWLTLISLIFSGGMAFVFLFRGEYKMYNSPDENPNIVKNDGLVGKQGFFDPSTKSFAEQNGKNISSDELERRGGGSPVKQMRSPLNDSETLKSESDSVEVENNENPGFWTRLSTAIGYS